MLTPDAFPWPEHRFFVDAPEIVDRAAEIDNLLSRFGPFAATWDSERLVAGFAEIFGGLLPKWPELDRWGEDADTLGEKCGGFGWPFAPAPEDYLEWATMEDLRAAARTYRLGSIGRTKAEAMASIVARLSTPQLQQLRSAGRQRWHHLEFQPAMVARFRILEHALGGILCSVRVIASHLEDQAETQWSSARDEDGCRGCRGLDGTRFDPDIAVSNYLRTAPPLHLVCRCVTL